MADAVCGRLRTRTATRLPRTDHQAFGEEIGVGVGLRKIEQGYSAEKATRQGYGLTENDESSGQQHTWFRKLETQAGRWTSPDPYNGSMQLGDPRKSPTSRTTNEESKKPKGISCGFQIPDSDMRFRAIRIRKRAAEPQISFGRDGEAELHRK